MFTREAIRILLRLPLIVAITLLFGCSVVVRPATNDAHEDVLLPGDGAVPDQSEGDSDVSTHDRADVTAERVELRDAAGDEGMLGPCEPRPSEVVKASTSWSNGGYVLTSAGCIWHLRDDPQDNNGRRIAELLPHVSSVRDIAGDGYLCAIMGSVARNLRGPRPDSMLFPSIPDAIAVTTADLGMCAIHSDRTISCSGQLRLRDRSFIELATPRRVAGVQHAVAIFSYDGGIFPYFAILADGRIVSWGGELIASEVAVLRGADAPRGVSSQFACFRMRDGTVRCAGLDAATACGATGPGPDPICLVTEASIIPGLSDITQVTSANGLTSFALRPSGQILWWGRIREGGPSLYIREPAVFPELSDATQIWGGSGDLLAVRRDGTLWSYTGYSERSRPALNRVDGFGPR